eukprot:10644666-Alexandrium_andersonii.AAC.1
MSAVGCGQHDPAAGRRPPGLRLPAEARRSSPWAGRAGEVRGHPGCAVEPPGRPCAFQGPSA